MFDCGPGLLRDGEGLGYRANKSVCEGVPECFEGLEHDLKPRALAGVVYAQDMPAELAVACRQGDGPACTRPRDEEAGVEAGWRGEGCGDESGVSVSREWRDSECPCARAAGGGAGTMAAAHTFE